MDAAHKTPPSPETPKRRSMQRLVRRVLRIARYWKCRAKFFEARAYENLDTIRDLEDRDDGADWWKRQ